MHCWSRCKGRKKRPHSELILAWYCCMHAAGVVLVHCSDALDVQRLNLCLRVVHTGYVKPVTCWSYILEKPFRYFVHFSFLSACHASAWDMKPLSQRTMERTQNLIAFFYPVFLLYYCIFMHLFIYNIVHLLICAIVFCRGVSYATFPSGIWRQALMFASRALFLREGTPTFYLCLSS